MAACAKNAPQTALYFEESVDQGSRLTPADIRLALGRPAGAGDEEYVAQIGWEQVVVIVNLDNPLDELPADALKQIFAGQIGNWEKGNGQPIEVWVLPEADPLRMILDGALKLDQLLAPQARMAPDIEAMLAAVSEDKNAIGYLPQSFLLAEGQSPSGKVKAIQLDKNVEQAFHQPVLAITQAEPAGSVRSLLVCLQAVRP